MKYYPVGLNIADKKCVVVGGGEVGERKAVKLLECGAAVRVVSKTLTACLEDMKRKGAIEHIDAEYTRHHLAGAFLAFGATDRPDVNARISHDAREMGIPVNVADDPPECDFILPALVERGDLTIAILTGGGSPALAKKLRLELEERFGPEYGVLLNIMAALREKVLAKGRPSEKNKEIFETIIRSDTLKKIKEGKWMEIKRFIKETSGEDIEVGP